MKTRLLASFFAGQALKKFWKLEALLLPVCVCLLLGLAAWWYGRPLAGETAWGHRLATATPTQTLVPADGWWTSLPTPAPLPTRPAATPTLQP
jgi:hypothetical protein